METTNTNISMKYLGNNTYVEDGYAEIPKLYLNNEEYAQAMQSLIIVCTDTVFVDLKRKLMYLTKRQALPMKGLWWFGGRQPANEINPVQSAKTKLGQETHIDIALDQFHYVGGYHIFWKDRQQLPQNIGCHVFDQIFYVNIDAEKLAELNLDKEEYDQTFGLQTFNRQQLIEAGVVQIIIDVYDRIFPQKTESSIISFICEDDRRIITEANLRHSDISVQKFKIISKATLGQHYHLKKEEIFIFLSGGGVAYTAQVDTEGKISPKIESFDVFPNFVLRIPAGQAHRFDLETGTNFIVISTKPFDKNDLINCPIVLT